MMFLLSRRLRRFCLLFLLGLTFWLLVQVVTPGTNVVIAKSLTNFKTKALPWEMRSQVEPGNENEASMRVQQGLRLYEAGKITAAINVWEQALGQISNALDRAVVRTNLALAYRQVGNLNEAVQQWEQAIQIYRGQKNEARQETLAQLLVDQGQTYSDLGQQERGMQLLQSALEIARKTNLKMTEAVVLGALGNAYWAVGNYEQALASVEASLKIARELSGGEALIVTALNNLGNVYASRSQRYRYQGNLATIEGDDIEAARLNDLAQKDIAAAIASFEQLQGIPPELLAKLTHVPRSLRIALELAKEMAAPNWDLIAQNQSRILSILAELPDSRDKVYALINLASTRQSEQEAARLLGSAIASARNINDARAQSFALGSLGHLYEESGQYSVAMELTQQAQFAAQKTNAADSLYRWEWQAGRIFKVKGDRNRASNPIQINSIENLRSQL